MASIKVINKAIEKAGIPLELVKGEGYHYFVYDTSTHYDTHSVYYCYTNMLTTKQWVETARYVLEENIMPNIRE